MQLTFRVTNRAILRSGEDVQGNRYTIECEPSDLPQDVRRPLADRLFDDAFVCEGVLDEDNAVEPRFCECGEPMLLLVDGTTLQDLVEMIRLDHYEVTASLAEARSAKPLTQD